MANNQNNGGGLSFWGMVGAVESGCKDGVMELDITVMEQKMLQNMCL